MPKVLRSQRVEAVVLRHYDYGEADRILTVYTRELGKLRAIAKGVRRMHSRKAGHLQPFTRVSLLLARGRNLWIVTQAQMQDTYLSMREDLEKTAYAAYVVELLDRFSYEEGENRAIYRLLTAVLKRIADEHDAFLAVRYYEIRILDLLGFRPNLFHCVQCEKEIQPEDQYFSALLGGVLCPGCGFNLKAHSISMQTLKYMRHFQRSSYRDASRAKLTPEVRDELEAILQYYLTFLLERNLNSPSFIREVRRKL
jgi:DNA repair protein RecO (recombination protein O)